MTWADYTDKWKSLKADLKKLSGEELLAPPATVMLNAIKERVFSHGVTTQGEQMQEYSDRPRTFKRQDFVHQSAFKGKGNSVFLKGGYKELRDIQGFQTSYIDLNYTGKYKDSYKMRITDNRVLFVLGSQRAQRLTAEHENRFGEFLVATEDETANYSKIVVDSVDAKIIQTLT